jgi:segregation and condensation protein A
MTDNAAFDEKKSAALDEYIEKLRSSGEYVNYNIKLDRFEGPIDLLLHLVKLAKIKIEDIFVSSITEQYLSYMEQLGSVDLEKASEFIEVAAILIEIKSKSLLPADPADDQTEGPKRELIQKIEEYRLYKEASQKLKEIETVGVFFKEPDDTVGDPVVVLKDMNKDGLMRALQKLFLKLEKRALAAPQRKIELDRFTVAEKIARIKDVLLVRDEVGFFELFDAYYTKSEIITTFQALLELLKAQYARAEQNEVFGDILIKKY